jgi:glutamyl-Q tRNA(Asp) synthetase
MAFRPPVFRFAPSPNGLLHAGHALSALTNDAMARRAGGRMLLRIENIDGARSSPELEAALLEDLRWIGLRWDGGVRRQSEHMAAYRALLDRLRAEGLVYPAFMSRGAIRAHAAAHEPWPRDPDGAPLYPALDRALDAAERGRRIAAGEPFAWRLDMAEALRRAGSRLRWREWEDERMAATRTVAADPAAWGDVVLARRDLPTSYHLSVVADDAAQGVTDVVRGQDLFQATAVHRLLQTLFGLPEPTYFHHRLLLGADGRKLSKSEGALSLRAMRDAGRSPAEIRAALGLEPL